MKAKRPLVRRWRKAVSGLLFLAIGILAAFWASQNYCAIPAEIQPSRDFHMSLVQSDRQEATLLRMWHSEMSKQLAFLGTIDALEYQFHYGCQSDSCIFYRAVVHMRIAYSPSCAHKNGVSSHVVTVWTSMHDSYIEPPHLSSRATERTWDETSADVSFVKRYALESIEDSVWKLHQELRLEIMRGPGHWFIVFADSNRYSSLMQLEDSDILRLKEDKQ